MKAMTVTVLSRLSLLEQEISLTHDELEQEISLTADELEQEISLTADELEQEISLTADELEQEISLTADKLKITSCLTTWRTCNVFVEITGHVLTTMFFLCLLYPWR